MGAKGLPVRRDMYARWFRQIARAAGIPDDVWNMDARAGGATEADEAGAALDAIRGSMAHATDSMTLRYIRQGGRGKSGRSQRRAAASVPSRRKNNQPP